MIIEKLFFITSISKINAIYLLNKQFAKLIYATERNSRTIQLVLKVDILNSYRRKTPLSKKMGGFGTPQFSLQLRVLVNINILALILSLFIKKKPTLSWNLVGTKPKRHQF